MKSGKSERHRRETDRAEKDYQERGSRNVAAQCCKPLPAIVCSRKRLNRPGDGNGDVIKVRFRKIILWIRLCGRFSSYLRFPHCSICLPLIQFHLHPQSRQDAFRRCRGNGIARKWQEEPKSFAFSGKKRQVRLLFLLI